MITLLLKIFKCDFIKRASEVIKRNWVLTAEVVGRTCGRNYTVATLTTSLQLRNPKETCDQRAHDLVMTSHRSRCDAFVEMCML